MDRIDTEKKYAQLVEVINELKAKIETSPSNPLDVSLPSELIWGTTGSRSVRTYTINTATWVIAKPSSGNFNLCVGSCVASNQGASIVVPLNLVYYNVSSANETTLLADIESKLPLLFPSGTTINYTYSDMDSNGNVKFYVESVQ